MKAEQKTFDIKITVNEIDLVKLALKHFAESYSSAEWLVKAFPENMSLAQWEAIIGKTRKDFERKINRILGVIESDH